MAIRKAILCLAVGAVATVLGGQGIVIEEKPAFAPTDSFQTKGMIINGKFKTADGSVHPAGRYSFKVQGTGRLGEVAVIIQNGKTGKAVGKVMGAYETGLGGPDTKGSQRRSRSQTVKFERLGFSSASAVKIAPQGADFLLIINYGTQGSIRATLRGAH